jgi:hypothetical protein
VANEIRIREIVLSESFQRAQSDWLEELSASNVINEDFLGVELAISMKFVKIHSLAGFRQVEFEFDSITVTDEDGTKVVSIPKELRTVLVWVHPKNIKSV